MQELPSHVKRFERGGGVIKDMKRKVWAAVGRHNPRVRTPKYMPFVGGTHDQLAVDTVRQTA
jgi:hypothetical protein